MTFLSRSALRRKGARWLKGPRGRRLAGGCGGARGPGIAWARAREGSGAVVEPRGLVFLQLHARVLRRVDQKRQFARQLKLSSTCERAGVRGFNSALGSGPGLPSARGVALFAELGKDADATTRATRGLSATAAARTRLCPPAAPRQRRCPMCLRSLKFCSQCVHL